MSSCYSKLTLLFLALVLCLSSCNLPNQATSVSTTEPAITNVPTLPLATHTPIPLPTETVTVIPTATHIVISITASGGNINIRRGPGVGYNPISAFQNGQIAAASARSDDNKWLYIPIPGVDGQFGWVSAITQFSAITGDISLLPVMTVPPFESAYIRNCTFHEMLIKPVNIKVPDQTFSPKNNVQFNPGDYEVFDTTDTGGKPIQTIQLREGNTFDINKDSLDNLYACP